MSASEKTFHASHNNKNKNYYRLNYGLQHGAYDQNKQRARKGPSWLITLDFVEFDRFKEASTFYLPLFYNHNYFNFLI